MHDNKIVNKWNSINNFPSSTWQVFLKKSNGKMLPHSNKQEQKLIASKISLQYHHILQNRPSTISEQTWMRKTCDCIQMCPCTNHIKKITHMKKLGHTSEFLFGIYWWTWKTTIYWKLLKWPIKNVRILIFTILY